MPLQKNRELEETVKLLLIPMNPRDQVVQLGQHWAKENQMFLPDFTFKGGRKGLRQIRYFLHVLGVSLRTSFDAIFCMELPQALLGGLIKLIKRKPLITYVIDDIVNLRLARDSKFSYRKILNLAQQIGARMSDSIITVDEKQIEWLKKIGGGEVIPLMYGVDINSYLPEIPPPNPKSTTNVTVSYSGGFYRHHGAYLFLQAIPIVHQTKPEITFRIAGNAPKEIRRSYNSKKIQFYDILPKVKYVEFLKQSDILVCPPHPPFPHVSIVTNKLMDYLACGRPVVGTDTGAIGNLLREGDAGVPVPPTPRGVADGIIKLTENPNQRQRQGINALKLAKKRFDWNKNNTRIYNIIKDHISKK